MSTNENYAHAQVAFMTAEINLLTDNIKIAALNDQYPAGAIAIANDQWFTSIQPYVLAGLQPIRTLTGKSLTTGNNTGIFIADSTIFTNIVAGFVLGFYCIFKDPDPTNIDGPPSLGNAGSSRVIHLISSSKLLGMGTNGASILFSIPSTGLFRL